MFNWLARIKKHIDAYRESSFLNRHNVSSWEEYHYVYDPDVNKSFGTVTTQYHGYGYVTVIRAGLQDYGFHGVDFDQDQYKEINQWCQDNCSGKFRVDVRILKRDKNTIINTSTYVTSIQGGAEHFVIAFKERNDHLLFEMVWQ